MCKITFKISFSGADYYLHHIDGTLPLGISLEKALGGPILFQKSRWWTHHGGGNWITDYVVDIRDVEKVKQSLQSFGIESQWKEKSI